MDQGSCLEHGKVGVGKGRSRRCWRTTKNFPTLSTACWSKEKAECTLHPYYTYIAFIGLYFHNDKSPRCCNSYVNFIMTEVVCITIKHMVRLFKYWPWAPFQCLSNNDLRLHNTILYLHKGEIRGRAKQSVFSQF